MNIYTDPEGKQWEITGEIRKIHNGEHWVGRDGLVSKWKFGASNTSVYAIVRPIEPKSPFAGEGKRYPDGSGETLFVMSHGECLLATTGGGGGVWLDEIWDAPVADMAKHKEVASQ